MRCDIEMCVGMKYLIDYNERKVVKKEAECIYAGNFLKDAGELTLADKRHRFADLIRRNPQTHRPATSVVAEFVPGEKLPTEDLIDIARDLMKGVDFGQQPYLVYHHKDTFHQHMHIISTKIRPNGDPIPESFIGVRRLQPTRILLETKYHLLTKSPNNLARHNPREKIQYGKTPIWQAMADTIKYVVDSYRYRSLDQLNAALRLYNLTVKGGAPGTHLYEHRGLYYQVIGENGKLLNAPVKASHLKFKPTLNNLEKTFAANNTLSATDIAYPRMLLDREIAAKPADPAEFLANLKREKLAVVPTFNKGSVTDFHFVDLGTKTVLSTSDLGSNYTAPALQTRLGFENAQKQQWEKKPDRGHEPSGTVDRENELGR